MGWWAGGGLGKMRRLGDDGFYLSFSSLSWFRGWTRFSGTLYIYTPFDFYIRSFFHLIFWISSTYVRVMSHYLEHCYIQRAQWGHIEIN
jgi:hypothetical protein